MVMTQCGLRYHGNDDNFRSGRHTYLQNKEKTRASQGVVRHTLMTWTKVPVLRTITLPGPSMAQADRRHTLTMDARIQSQAGPCEIRGEQSGTSSHSVFFYSFFTAVISTSILSHTIRFHLFISNYVVKLVAGTIL